MADNKSLAESIRNHLDSGADLLLTDDDYRTIIKTLEQEHCGDCISREQAKAEIRKAFPSLANRVDINSILNGLPSVKQEPKTDLDKIREEIANIEISGQLDSHTSFIRTSEQVKDMAIEIIDKYREEG